MVYSRVSEHFPSDVHFGLTAEWETVSMGTMSKENSWKTTTKEPRSQKPQGWNKEDAKFPSPFITTMSQNTSAREVTVWLRAAWPDLSPGRRMDILSQSTLALWRSNFLPDLYLGQILRRNCRSLKLTIHIILGVQNAWSFTFTALGTFHLTQSHS